MDKRLQRALELLKDYERWEAELIQLDEAWADNAALPTIPQCLWDRLIELQKERNEVLDGKG